MAKTKDEVATIEQPKNVPATLVVNEKQLDTAQAISMLKKADVGVELSTAYWTPEVGETIRAFMIDETTINAYNDETERVPAVKLLLEDNTMVINADKVLVSALLQQKTPRPFPVQIECIGMEKGKNGSYKKIVVNSLNLVN